jgi:serine/threonine-protein kinase
VLDFGIAKLASDEPNRMRTRTGALMGTPIYMSPEQCRGAGGVDHRSDIYSLGCVLYTMVTGHPPFDRLGTGEIIAAHLHEPVVPPRQLVPYLAPAAEQLIMRCLAKAPEERYASMIELAAALEHVLAHISGSAAAAAMPTVAMTPLPPGFRSEYPRAAATQARSTPGSVTGHPGPAQSPYAGHSGHIEVSVVRPTTLSQASGHVATRPPAAPRSSRPGVWIAAVLVLVAIGGGVAVVAGRGGADGAASSEPRDTSFAAAPPAAPRPPSAPSLVVQAPSTTAGVTVDAGVDAAAPVAVAPTTTSPAAAAPSTTPSTTTPAITTPSATAASANAPATAPAAASTKKTRPGRHAASKAGSGSSSEELYDTR